MNTLTLAIKIWVILIRIGDPTHFKVCFQENDELEIQLMLNDHNQLKTKPMTKHLFQSCRHSHCWFVHVHTRICSVAKHCIKFQ